MSDTPKRKRPKWGEPGSRVTRNTGAIVYSRGKRSVFVTVYADGLIGLRLSRHRTEEYVNAADIYRQAVASRVAGERTERRKQRRSA